MTVLHTGSTKKFAAGWAEIFSAGTKPTKKTAAAAKPATKQKTAKKKPAKKKKK